MTEGASVGTEVLVSIGNVDWTGKGWGQSKNPPTHTKKGKMDKYQRFLTEHELANYFKVSVHKLRRDRVENRGVPYIKYGRQVRYPVEIIEQFLSDNN